MRSCAYKGMAGLLCLAAHIPLGADLRYDAPETEIYSPLREALSPPNVFAQEDPKILEHKSTLFETREIIDFEKRQITFKKVDSLGIAVWQYHYDELDEYLRSRRRFVFSRDWHEAMARHEGGLADKDQPFALEFELPVHYPAWARRILGKEPPKLSIHGHEEIIVAYEYDDTKSEGVEQGKRSAGGLNFDNRYNLTVSGSVGRLINVDMKTSSEEEFTAENPLKDIKIEYRGEGDELEDEVIQEVTAGYTSFSLPGTNLSGYAGSHEGLFGISVRSKIGPLDLTTVVSHEQGEALKKTFSPSGASESQNLIQKAPEFAAYRYFFLDSLYRKAWNEKYAPGKPKQSTEVPKVKDVQVWKRVKTGSAERRERTGDITTPYRVVEQAGRYDNYEFKRLQRDSFHIDYDEGWIRFDQPLARDAIVGLYVSTFDTARVPNKGDTTFVSAAGAEQDTMKSLFVLKEESLDSTTTGFDLMWKNVYHLTRADGWDFDVKAYVLQGDGDTLYKDEKGNYYSYLLGLTENTAEGKPLANDDIYDRQNHCLIIPPFSADYRGNEPFRNPDLGKDNISPRIYEVKLTHLDEITHRIELLLTGSYSTENTEFSLDYGVIENSEKVTADGERLKRNIDYRVRYDLGELELISAKARNARKIEVEYQRESLFVPENKTFMGARGEVRLPFVSDKSYIGTSLLYQVSSSREDVPRLGREPFNKLLLDLNTSLDFEPEWMTALTNSIPLVSTDAASSVNVNFEVAHSTMTPNSNKKGEAFVDNFEAAKRTYPLGTTHRAWDRASPPVPEDSLLYYPPAWNFYWFSPSQRDADYSIERRNIFRLTEEELEKARHQSSQDQDEPVLRLHCNPAGPGLESRYDNPWAGIMAWFPAASADRSEDQYLEFVVNAVNKEGKLYVDLGTVSEDLAQQGGPPDNRWNDEDIKGIGEFDSLLNTGYDGILDDREEFYLVPNTARDGWDTLRYGDERLPFPGDPSGDNYKPYDSRNLDNFRRVVGSQGNPPPLSSEDINGDGFSKENDFYRFALNLEALDTSRFKDPSANTQSGWHVIRIPLESDSASSIHGEPSWDEIKFVRLWWTGFASDSTTRELIFARMQFVGNQWEEVAIPPRDTNYTVEPVPAESPNRPPRFERRISSVSGASVTVSVVNTEDDSGYKANVDDLLERKRRKGWIDRKRDRYDVWEREQSLKISFQDLAPGEEAVVQKYHNYNSMDFSSYERISLLVHCGDPELERDSVHFVFRFGTDREAYYEYRRVLDANWPDRDNGWRKLTIDLAELSDAKLAYLRTQRDTVDTAWQIDQYTSYAIRSSAAGPPSFSNIRRLMLGVVRTGENGGGGRSLVSGNIWVNELKVSGLSGIGGSAGLFSVQTSWADFLTAGGNVDYYNGDFRKMTQQSTAPGNSRLVGAMSSTMNMDRFLPREWGVAVPLTGKISGTLDRPQLKPGSDISLADSEGEPDKLRDMTADAVNAVMGTNVLKSDKTKAEHYETHNVRRILSTSYRKSSRSDNPLVNFTADRVSVGNLSYQSDITREAQGQKAGENSDYLDSTSNQTYRGGLSYDLSPRDPPQWTSWSPFERSQAQWMSKLKRYKLNGLPSTLKLDLVENASYVKHYRFEEKRDSLEEELRTFDISHGLTWNYAPISPLLDFNYTVSTQRNLNRALELRADRNQGWGSFARDYIARRDPRWKDYYFLYGEERRSQNASMSFNPETFSWLRHDFTYRAGFSSSENIGSGVEQRTTRSASIENLNFGVNSSFEFSGSFDINSLVRDLANVTKSVKPVSSSLEQFRSWMDRVSLRSLGFNYTATSDLKNNNMSLESVRELQYPGFLAYQLGLRDRRLRDIVAGEMSDRSDFGGMLYRLDQEELDYNRESRAVSRDWGANSGFTIPDPVDLRFSSVSLDRRISYTATPDTTRRDTTVEFPKIGARASWSILTRIPPVQKNLSSPSLSSGYNYTRSVTKQITHLEGEEPVESKSSTRTHQFSPLVSFGGTLKKWPVRLDYKHQFTHETTDNTETSKRNIAVNHGDTWDIGYTIKKNLNEEGLKLLQWTIPLKGNIETGLTATHDHRKAETVDRGEGSAAAGAPQAPATETENVRTISVKPSVSYGFTDRVTGGASYQWSKTTDDVLQRTDRNHIFQLSVRISF